MHVLEVEIFASNKTEISEKLEEVDQDFSIEHSSLHLFLVNSNPKFNDFVFKQKGILGTSDKVNLVSEA